MKKQMMVKIFGRKLAIIESFKKYVFAIQLPTTHGLSNDYDFIHFFLKLYISL